MESLDYSTLCLSPEGPVHSHLSRTKVEYQAIVALHLY